MIVPLPPLSGSSRTFAFDRELLYRVGDYTKGSRVVLYDNGAAALEYPTLSVYHGRWENKDGVIGIWWSARVNEPYGATAELKGDSLTLRFSLMMQMSDFEDAVYVRAR